MKAAQLTLHLVCTPDILSSHFNEAATETRRHFIKCTSLRSNHFHEVTDIRHRLIDMAATWTRLRSKHVYEVTADIRRHLVNMCCYLDYV